MIWTAILGLGIGLTLLTHALLDGLLSLLPGQGRTRRGRFDLARFAGQGRQRTVHQQKADLTGLDRFPWTALHGLAVLIGGLAYMQTRWAPILLIPLLPAGVRAYLENLRQRQLARQTWHFLMDLRLRLGLKGSLLLALQEIARAGQSPLSRLLRDYMSIEHEGGLTILSRMAADTRLPYLSDLVAQVEAAQSGTLPLDEAIRRAMQRVQAEMETRLREQLQKVPSRLILLVFPGLLGPALFVLVIPLVARVIAAMQGFSWGGGF